MERVVSSDASEDSLDILPLVLWAVVSFLLIPLSCLFLSNCLIPGMAPKTIVSVRFIGTVRAGSGREPGRRILSGEDGRDGDPVDGSLEVCVHQEDAIETLTQAILKHPDTSYNDDVRLRFLRGELRLFFEGRAIMSTSPVRWASSTLFRAENRRRVTTRLAAT